jgi:hypothetical protein
MPDEKDLVQSTLTRCLFVPVCQCSFSNLQVVPIKTTFAFNPDHLRYSTVSLSNQWLTDGTGQVSLDILLHVYALHTYML